MNDGEILALEEKPQGWKFVSWQSTPLPA